MLLKRKVQEPKDYITAGMAFFLIGIFASMFADGRLIGAFFSNMIPDESLMNSMQGFADGFSLPMFFASIFFNLRGLMLQRSR
jgi:Kef-type K+ transport system membrane component KefB